MVLAHAVSSFYAQPWNWPNRANLNRLQLILYNCLITPACGVQAQVVQESTFHSHYCLGIIYAWYPWQENELTRGNVNNAKEKSVNNAMLFLEWSTKVPDSSPISGIIYTTTHDAFLLSHR